MMNRGMCFPPVPASADFSGSPWPTSRSSLNAVGPDDASLLSHRCFRINSVPRPPVKINLQVRGCHTLGRTREISADEISLVDALRVQAKQYPHPLFRNY